jgi:hypothetical protein
VSYGRRFQFQTVATGLEIKHIRIQFDEVGAASAAVPEPSSAALAAIGLAAAHAAAAQYAELANELLPNQQVRFCSSS